MDEISLLRRLRDDIPERSPEAVTRGRAELFRAIEGASPRATANRSRRRRGFAWAGFSALGAGALTVALVAGNVLGAGVPGGPGGADAAAASVLESAAIATLETSDPVLAPGQFLRVQSDAIYGTSGETPEESYDEAVHEELYVPADRADDWVWVGCKRVPINLTTPDAQRAAAEHSSMDEDLYRVAPGGELYEGARIEWVDSATLPRDPQQLLTLIYEQTENQGQSRDGEAFAWVANLLRQGTVPADLRASVYRATMGIPGVTVTEEQATLNGTTGIAIGRVETASGVRADIVIDPKTGAFIGERSVSVDEAGNPLPNQGPGGSTFVTTTVVDSAPTDTSLCEAHR